MRKLFILFYVLISITTFNKNPCYAAGNSISLTEDEISFIEEHPVIRLGVDPNFVPFEFIDKDGEYKGIAADYISLLSEKTGIQFEVIKGMTWPEAYDMALSGDVDALSAISKTDEREEHFLFSEPYYFFKRVIVTRDTETDISGIQDLEGLTVAVQLNSSHHSYLLSKPKINLSLYDSVEAALTAVANGTERSYVGNIATTNYLIRSIGLTNLKFIAFEPEKQQALYFAVHKECPELVSILNKAFATITEEEKIAINNKWIDLKQETDYTPFMRIVFIIGVLVAVVMAVSFYWISILRKEIQKRKIIQIELEKAKQESERSKSVFLSHLPGLAYRCNYDKDWTMQYVSEGCLNLTGYSPESLLYNRDLSFNDIITKEYRSSLWKEWKRILAKKLPFKYEYEIITAQGERKWVLEMGQGIYDEQGEVIALEGIVLDISDRKEIENTLRYNSEHDIWTGLYNRRYLENLLKRDNNIQTMNKRAVISVNLSTVHSLSLIYGFHYSKDLINKVGESLATLCPDKCQLFFSTYEYSFVFYFNYYKDKTELIVFCENVVNTLKSVLDTERIGGGIGILEINDDNKRNIEKILKNLLIASEKALSIYDRDFGFCFFNTSMEEQIIREEEIKCELARIASDKNSDSLFLLYQPIYDVKSKKITGFEVLSRINSDILGPLAPSEFIPIAEKTKLIIQLGDKIIFQAFKFLNRLKANGYETISVSINISVVQLLRDDFIKNLLN